MFTDRFFQRVLSGSNRIKVVESEADLDLAVTLRNAITVEIDKASLEFWKPENRTPAATNFPTQTSFPAQTSFPVETSYPAETTFPARTSFPDNTGFPARSSFPATTSFPARTSFPDNTGFPARSSFPDKTGFTAQTAFPNEESGNANTVPIASKNVRERQSKFSSAQGTFNKIYMINNNLTFCISEFTILGQIRVEDEKSFAMLSSTQLRSD